jgi:pimeloyl-ACP methyl ester carboxylesterase
MRRTITLPGHEATERPDLQEKPSAFLKVDLLTATAVDAKARGAGSREKAVYDEAEPGDVVEVEFENGLKQWFSVAQLEEALKQQQAGPDRGMREAGAPQAALGEGGALEVPLIWAGGDATRGWVTSAARLGAKFVRLLRPKLEEKLEEEVEKLVADKGPELAAKLIAGFFERKLEGQINSAGEALYRFNYPQELLDEPLTAKDLNNSQPYLLFIHGTASSTVGGFSRLGIRHGFDVLKIDTTPEWEDLQRQYKDRVIAYEHHTLSRSPMENAISLAKTLPDGAKLHLVTHSRGGLVGELLCLSQVKELSMAGAVQSLLERLELPFASAKDSQGKPIDRSADIEHLRELVDVLSSKQFQVERFVRVACPARGTTLASKKINDLFSSILNLLEYLPWMQASPILDFTRSTFLALLKYPTDPKKLPGIEAMMPESPFIQMLNGLNLMTESDLAVIEGDLAPGDLFDRMKFGAVEKLFGEDNDLVVNTRAMTGGMKRAQGVFKLNDQGQEVNHFSYFNNHRTRVALYNWLALEQPVAERAAKAKFEVVAPEADGEAITRGTRGPKTENLPLVFVLPGIMGSHLSVKNDRIWLDPYSLAKGGMARLAFDAPDVIPEALVGSAYRSLIDFLKARHEVIPFAYDWRLSLLKCADSLKKAVEIELNKHKRPIRLLAHSMGGLVARTMIAQYPEIWERLKERDCRLVMLGTPNNGSFVIPQLYAGREKLLRMLALVDLKHSQNELIEIVTRYPGLAGMLPERFLKQAEWDNWKKADGKYHLARPTDDLLEEADGLRKKLKTEAIDVERMCYVAGSSPSTPFEVKLENGAVVFYGTPDGDGRVTYQTGLIEGVKTWYVDAEHGDLAAHKDSFLAYDELLDKGATNRLATKPKVRRGVGAEAHVILDEEPQMFPDENDLAVAALGKRIKETAVGAAHALAVSVVHTDLRNASYPIAVGHYKGDLIVGTEGVIDRAMKGRLSQLLQAGLYPGEVGTAEVVRAKDSDLQGALIIGLGEFGEVNRDKVRAGIVAASTRNALRVLNEDEPGAEQGWRSAAFSTLLIGAYSSGMVSVADSVTAIIQGAVQANRMLQKQNLWDEVRIDKVEIIELYEDVATQAVHAARRLTERPPLELNPDEELVLDPPFLEEKDGGQPQRPPDQYAAGWWRRIKIAVDKKKAEADGVPAEPEDPQLTFTVFSERARLEEKLLPTQRKLVEGFVRKAIDTPDPTNTFGATLFELLVPYQFKDQVSSEGDLLLFVDNDSAQYPWELMAQRTREGNVAVVSERGMIRQLVTDEYRANPQSAQGDNILVVGDPILNSKDFQQLDGAKKEAEIVNNMLKSRFANVTSSIREDALEIVRKLFESDYRIVHLAGHGYYDEKHPLRSGMVLGDDMWLTAAEFQQMRIVPDLVFINCCHLAALDRKPLGNKLAASVSLALIRMGVKAVVAAGWAVDDAAAKTFAEVFYEEMLANNTFGNAAQAARRRVYKEHRDTNTWGAYQCYGSPDFRLERLTDGQKAGDAAFELLSPREYRDELQRSAARAKGLNAEAAKKLRKQLESLYDSMPQKWLDGRMLSTFGEAWAALGELEESAKFYHRALGHEKANVDLKAIQSLANLLGRQAGAVHRAISEAKGKTEKARAKRKDLKDYLDEEFVLLLKLKRLSRTSELSSLLGSHFKRRARLEADDKIRKYLTKSAGYYKDASDLARENTGAIDPYPALNWLTCEVVLRSFPKDRAEEQAEEDREDFRTEFKQVEQAAGKLSDHHEIWKRLHLPDTLLLKYLLQETLGEKGKQKAQSDEEIQAEIVAAYRDAIEDRIDRTELNSVLGQIDFLIEMFERIEGKKSRKKTSDKIAALNHLRGEIVKIAEK